MPQAEVSGKRMVQPADSLRTSWIAVRLLGALSPCLILGEHALQMGNLSLANLFVGWHPDSHKSN